MISPAQMISLVIKTLAICLLLWNVAAIRVHYANDDTRLESQTFRAKTELAAMVRIHDLIKERLGQQ